MAINSRAAISFYVTPINLYLRQKNLRNKKGYNTLIQLILKLTFLISLTLSSLAHSQKDDAKLYNSPNAQLYRAQQLLKDTKNSEQVYELLRDLLKNDDTINRISRKKIQWAADEIESIHFWDDIKRLFNSFRHKERPFIKAKYFLSEAIMDSRVALNESSDTEILFVENLLKNYFYPGHPEKVTIHYPPILEFAFDTWALTQENLIKDKIGVSTQDVPLMPSYIFDPEAQEMFDKGSLDLSEEEIVSFFGSAVELTKTIFLLKESYDNLKTRVINRYLYQAMLFQAIAEPGSVLLDPQLNAFLKKVKIEIDLGETEELSEDQRDMYAEYLGDDIFQRDDYLSSIDLTKLLGLNHKGLDSNLKLIMKKSKSDATRETLSIVSSVAGEDLLFIRVLQVMAVGLKDGDEIASSKVAITSVNLLDKVFDKLASFANAIRGAQNSGGGKWVTFVDKIQAGIGGAFKFPSQVYNGIKGTINSPAGQRVITAINKNPHIQNGTLMKGLVGLGVIAELVTATIEYQYLETKREKLDKVSETAARVSATGSYLIPIVGQVAALIDLGHFTIGYGFETADIYRTVGYLAGKATLAYYGFSETTIELTKLENSYRIPRHYVYLKRHGAHIDSLEEAESRRGELFKEMENITLNNISLLYRAHRQLDRGANTDFGERIQTYHESFKENLKTYRSTAKQIEDEIAALSE